MRPVEEGVDRRMGLLQALHVRTIATELQSIAETMRRLLPPRIKNLGARQTVERMVDLHGIEVLGVVDEPALLRDVPGVEDSLPVIILIARGPDTQLPSLGTHQSPFALPCSGVSAL
jgi:hypothetical protein